MMRLLSLQGTACSVCLKVTDNPTGPVWRGEIQRALTFSEARGRGSPR